MKLKQPPSHSAHPSGVMKGSEVSIGPLQPLPLHSHHKPHGLFTSAQTPGNLSPKVLGTFESLDLRSSAVFSPGGLLFTCGRSVIRHLSCRALVTTKTEHFKTNAIPSWDICANFIKTCNKIRNVSVACTIMSKCIYLTSETHQAKNPPIVFLLFYIYIFP